jgi:SnoaL-like domain
MTKVIIGEDCGNSPKNIFVQELTIAFAKGESKFILDRVTDDIRWNIVGDTLIEGKDNFIKAIERMKNDKVAQLTIHHVATHGKAGAVNGTSTFEDGKTRAFCHVYEFSNTKAVAVKEIISYIMEIR